MISLLLWSYNFTLNDLFPAASLQAFPSASINAFPDWSEALEALALPALPCNGFQERSIGEVTNTILEASVVDTTQFVKKLGM